MWCRARLLSGSFLCTALIGPSLLRAQVDAPQAASEAAFGLGDLAGYYDVIATVDPTTCVLQKIGGEARGTIEASAGRRGLLVHLESLHSYFDSPIEVTVAADGGMSFQGPIRVRIGSLSDQAAGLIVGRIEPQGRSFKALYELNNNLCTIRGSLAGSRTAAAPPVVVKTETAASEALPTIPGPSGGAASVHPETLVPPAFAALVGQDVSFQASNYPDRFIRHRFSLGVTEPITDDLARDDATFRIVPGLAGRCVSLESHNYPGQYLRHHGWRIRLAPREDNDMFRNDATFCMVPGLAGSTGVTFESVNNPQHFIRHRSNELWVDPFDGGDLFRRDATFNVTHPGGALIIR